MSLEKYSNALHSSFVPQCECVSDFGRVGISLGASHLCAVSERGDTCGGDSGGGLVRAVGSKNLSKMEVTSSGEYFMYFSGFLLKDILRYFE